jgi:hypothetical protein
MTIRALPVLNNHTRFLFGGALKDNRTCAVAGPKQNTRRPRARSAKVDTGFASERAPTI